MKREWRMGQVGFTLVELLIAVSIVGIITAVAYPAYTRQVQATNQQRAQGELMSLMAAADAFRAQNFSYLNYTVATPAALADRYTFFATIAANNQRIVLRALPKGPQAGSGALGINSQGQTCLAASDTGCAVTDEPWTHPWK